MALKKAFEVGREGGGSYSSMRLISERSPLRCVFIGHLQQKLWRTAVYCFCHTLPGLAVKRAATLLAPRLLALAFAPLLALLFFWA